MNLIIAAIKTCDDQIYSFQSAFQVQRKFLYYRRIPITRSFRGNRKRFEQEPITPGSSYRKFELPGVENK